MIQSNNKTLKWISNNRFLMVKIVVALVAVLIFIISIRRWQSDMIHGNECLMTYSRPHYIPINTSHLYKQDTSYHLYSVYRYLDGYDKLFPPYYYHQHDTNRKNNNEYSGSWCYPREDEDVGSHVVIFVPGQGGSYEQVRSLGSHLAEQQQKQHQQSQPLLYVYSIDWEQERWMGGSGWHVKILQQQAGFLRVMLEDILRQCHSIQQLSIVGHSLGGIVARTALQNLTAHHISNRMIKLVTLATPHAYFPYATWWNPTWHNFYQNTLENNHNNIQMISISGMFRDELIPPSSTFLLPSSSDNHKNILATDLMERNHEAYTEEAWGMDHKAIVWCYPVLQSLVHHYILNNDIDESNNETVHKEFGSERWYQKLIQKDKEIQQKNGIFKWIGIQLTLPYAVVYLLIHIYPSMVLCHMILTYLVPEKQTFTILISPLMLFLFQYGIKRNLYPNHPTTEKNTIWMPILLTIVMNCMAIVVYCLHIHILHFFWYLRDQLFNKLLNLKRNKNHHKDNIKCNHIPTLFLFRNNNKVRYMIILITISVMIIFASLAAGILVFSFFHLCLLLLSRHPNNDEDSKEYQLLMDRFTFLVLLPNYLNYMIQELVYLYYYEEKCMNISPRFLVGHMILNLWNIIYTLKLSSTPVPKSKHQTQEKTLQKNK